VARKNQRFFALTSHERDVAGAILAVLLLGPIVILAWLVVPGFKFDDPLITVIIFVCFLGLTIVLGAIVASTVRRHRSGISLRSLGNALVWFALIQLLYGVWVLATGLTPGKFNAVSVPRTHSVVYFAWGVVLALLGLTAIVVGRNFQRDAR